MTRVRELFGSAVRSINWLPWNVGGQKASEVTADRAISLIPFFACVRLLSEQVSSLPLHTYRDVDSVQQRITDAPLIRFPSAHGTRIKWLRQLVTSLAMRGNAYGLIVATDGFGFPTQVEWLHPDEVWVDEAKPTLPVYYWLGQVVPREKVVHITWFVEPGKVVGLSPVSQFAATLGVGLQATNYGLTWFENGGTPPGTFKNSSAELSPEQSRQVADDLSYAVRNRKPIVYGKNWDFTALKVTPEESQFIETHKLTATQIAAIFGIPPEMVGGEAGGSLTYDTVEGNGLNFLRFVLRPWLVLIESELSALLPNRQYVQFNADAVVRADLKTRYEAHQIGLTAGFLTVNEVRALEDLPPIEGGDVIRVPSTVAVPELPPAPNARSLNGHHLQELNRV